MPRRPVYTDIADVLERRVSAGHYMIEDLPGERKLASELGVSYMTARKAVMQLIDRRVLARRQNGTLVVHPEVLEKDVTCRVALLVPAYPAPQFARFRLEFSRVAGERGAQLRPIEYMYWDDAVVSEALEASDGVIVVPSTEPVPERMARAMRSPGVKVVAFDGDLVECGVPSISLFPSEHIAAIYEHLADRGFTRIDCLNTQGRNEEIEHRIAHWRAWTRERGLEGMLHDDPAPAYEDPLERAHGLMHRVLAGMRSEAGGVSPTTAVVCTTSPAAAGVVRACFDQGVHPGRDLGVCAMNNEPTGRFSYPSMTGLEMPDISPLVEPCFDWFAQDAEPRWPGERMITPTAPRLLLGESTGVGLR